MCLGAFPVNLASMTNRYNTRRTRPLMGPTQTPAAPSGPDSAQQDRPVPQQQRGSQARTGERHNCGMCDQDLGSADCIGCDECESWLHANVMCTGLPDALIKSLLDYGGTGVKFVCSKCRVASCAVQTSSSPSAGPQRQQESNEELIKQLFWSVKGICIAVRDLTSRLDATLDQLSSNRPKPSPSVAPPTTYSPDPEQHRRQIREEVREMQEQAKRRQSVIIRGLGVSSLSGVASSFSSLTERMFGMKVELSDVVPIPNHQDLFRAKILNEENRKLVLTRAKSLRDTEYGQVFIRRDLTYKQRQELRNRMATADQQGTRQTQVHDRPHVRIPDQQHPSSDPPTQRGSSLPSDESAPRSGVEASAPAGGNQ